MSNNLPEVLEECWNLDKHSERWIEASDAIAVEIVYKTVKGDSVRVEFRTDRKSMAALRVSIMAAAVRKLKYLIGLKGSEPCNQGDLSNGKARGRVVRGKKAGSDQAGDRGGRQGRPGA